MTEEYFYIEEVAQPQVTEETEKNIHSGKNTQHKIIFEPERNVDLSQRRSQDLRLIEMEQQLEMAESRCNALKGQVDFMKMLYNGMGKEEKEKTTKNTSQNTKNASQNTKNASQNTKNKSPRHLSVECQNVVKRKHIEKTKDRGDQISKGESSEEVMKEKPSRDVDRHIETKSVLSTVPHHDSPAMPLRLEDNSAAVKSINLILNGITKSVNKLSELHVEMGPTVPTKSGKHSQQNDMKTGIQNTHCSPRNLRKTKPEKPYQNEPASFPRILEQSTMTLKSRPIDKTKPKIKRRSRSLLTKKTSSKLASAISVSEIKKRIKATAKHVEKKTKLSIHTPLADVKIRKKPITKIRSKPLQVTKTYAVIDEHKPETRANKGSEWRSEKLIELYHNSNLKMGTTSEDSIAVTSKKQLESKNKNIVQTAVQQERIPEHQQIDFYKPTLPQIDERHTYSPNYTPRQETYTKNYELPTIASKMKQVAKSYFQNFNFRTIPFVAAKSVTPSHNLGINIQQVLSIIKGKKPVTGISPTLAYNIELAANKLGSRPLSALVSTLGSRINNGRYACPLGRRMNFARLQEMAKEIPEEPEEESQAFVVPNESLKTVRQKPFITRDKREQMWSTDPNKKREQCTCLPKPGVNFNEVCNKYMNKEPPANARPFTVNTNVAAFGQKKRMYSKPWNINSTINNVNRNALENNMGYTVEAKCQTAAPDSFRAPSERNSMILKREKNLKEVLRNLHEEFKKLNDRYDDLKHNITNGAGQDADAQLKELERLEKDLLNKEEEITMVMSLYKEVSTLKQQIKVLKRRASQASVTVTPYNKYKDYKDQNAAGHLTKLLRHIQQFQESLKNK